MMQTTLGNILYNQGKRDEAIATYRRVLDRNVRWFYARTALAQVLAETGQKDKALQLLEEGRRLHPRLAHWENARGQVLLNLGDGRGAEAAFRKVLGSGRATPYDWAGLGTALTLQDRYDEALQAQRKAVHLLPSNSNLRALLASSLFLQGSLEEAVVTAREAIQLNPANAGAHRTLGWALAKQQKYVAAETAFAEVLKLQPQDTFVLQRGLIYNGFGNTLFEKQRYAEAAQAYEQANTASPKDALYRCHVANAYYRAGDYKHAEEAARAAIKLAPMRFEGYNVLGHILFARGKLEEAVNQYQQAIARRRGDAVLHVNLANTFFEQKNPAAAEAEYRKAGSLNQQYADPRLSLGILLLNKGKAAEAEAELRQAVKLAPKNSAAHARLSTALLMQGKTMEAVAAARRGVELAPSRAREHFRLGDALLAQGAFAEALAVFHQAKRLRTPVDDKFDPLPWDERIRESTRWLELDATLAAVQRGKLKVTDATEQTALARFCLQQKNQPLTAVRLYREAFDADQKLASDLTAGHRYSAAGAAARAAGQEKEPKEQAGWRKQALEWLRADLAAWTKQLEGASPQGHPQILRQLQHWQHNPDLVGLRDEVRLARLPEADRDACRKLWVDVDALCKRIGQK
jgi:tetratricopeptide (TPR) repeat protein